MAWAPSGQPGPGHSSRRPRPWQSRVGLLQSERDIEQPGARRQRRPEQPESGQCAQAFGIDPNVDLGLGTLLTHLGFGTLVNEHLGNLLSGLGLLTPLTDSLNGLVGGLLTNPILENAFQLVGLDPGDLLTNDSLLGALNDLSVGQLLGGRTLNESLRRHTDRSGCQQRHTDQRTDCGRVVWETSASPARPAT